MKIATYANARSTFEACRGVQKAFNVAFQSGSVMGFLPTAFLSVKLFFKDDMVYMRPLLVMVLVDPQ
jgi:Na+/H+-translocating membrane pyrophosphatase